MVGWVRRSWLIGLLAALLFVPGTDLAHGRAFIAGARFAPVGEAPARTAFANHTLEAAAEEEPLASAIEMGLFDLANDDRARNGLLPVAFDPDLLDVARVRAAAQVPGAPLSHMDTAGGLAIVGLLAGAGLDYRLAGENLARLSGPSSSAAKRAEEALMNSPGHRRNILEPTFNRLAVGAAVDSSGRIVYAQIFRAIDEEPSDE